MEGKKTHSSLYEIVYFHDYWLPHPKVRIVLNHLSCVPLFATLWTVAHQAPLFMGFSRQEYWSGLPCPPPGNLPDPGIKPVSLRSSANWRVDSLPLAPPGKPLVQNRHLIFIETWKEKKPVNGHVDAPQLYPFETVNCFQSESQGPPAYGTSTAVRRHYV